ncbi:anthocyanidin 3-O-glucoside 6''-O-acyltransferase-like [Triticum aestivum]|nr:anthocyanidin 3-O-glucoside 6''-O-acyltransferase-like [Triticum aestivum]
MGANSNDLRVLDAGVVGPSDLDLPPRSLPLTFFDVKWLRPPPVQRLFLYRLQHNHNVDQLISDLKASLSKALTLFYPLAGHVRLAPNSGNRYELFYQPGDGVAFTVAEYDADVEQDLARAEPVQVAKLAPLVPPLPKGRAVLAVQATVLLGGRGLALGVTLHHSACDGASSTHFLHTWAALCAGAAEMPPPPVIDRTLIADPRGLYDIYSKGLPSDGSEIEFVSSSVSSVPDDQLLGTFTLPQELLRGIKDTVAREAARQKNAPPPRCSSLLAAFSFMWSCYCRAKQEQNQTKTTYFLFSVDHRTRLKPRVPDRYLGNCLGPAIAAARHDELAAPGTEGLFAAFMAIAEALQEEVGEGSHDRWDACVERVKEAAKVGLFSVAGSPRFRVYGIDFGFGPPAKVDVVSVAKTGAMSMAEARDGHGGIEVGISLPTSGMEHFRRCFDDAMHAVGMQERVYI